LLILSLPAPALADTCPDEPGLEEACVGGSPWYMANRLRLHLESGEDVADWLFEIASASEYRITLDQHIAGQAQAGTLMVIDGKVMITRGMELELGSETGDMDAAALVQQLTLKLLQHAYPEGRAQVLGVEDFRLRREHLYIGAATSRAEAVFAPPWMVTGQIDNGNFDWVDFELDFEVPDIDYRALISGRWEELTNPIEFRDTMIIEDWQVWPLAPQPDPAPLNPGWTARDMRIVTLGDLRRIIGGG
jgi:hypothetical protein